MLSQNVSVLSSLCKPIIYLLLDAMATQEWKKEVQKHEQYIKDLEEKYKAKCEAMEVTTLD